MTRDTKKKLADKYSKEIDLYDIDLDEDAAIFAGEEVTILKTYVRGGKRIALIKDQLGETIEVYSELLE